MVAAFTSEPLPDDIGTIIRGNVIENNYAGDHGGGFHAGAVLSGGITELEFSWNLVYNNIADGIPQEGHSALIENNVVVFTKNGGGIECGGGVNPTIRNNLAWQNLPSDGVGDCSEWWQSNDNIVADPYFCNSENGDFTLAEDSPAITHPAGPLGAFSTPGCGPVPVKSTTWGRLKSMYR